MALLTLLLSGVTLRKRLAEWVLGVSREHDVAIFRKLDAVANEAVVGDLLNRRIYTSTFKLEDDALLANFIEELPRIENRYLDRKLRKQAKQLVLELAELLALVRRTFWAVGEGWLKFRPDPIDPEIYDREWKELNLKIDCAWNAYKRYRTTVKQRLRV